MGQLIVNPTKKKKEFIATSCAAPTVRQIAEEPIGGCLNNSVYEAGAGSDGRYASKKAADGAE